MVAEADNRHPAPSLERLIRPGGVTVWTDPGLAATGTVIAFSQRTGGSSAPPFDTLNLATHVGDDPKAVDTNRTLLFDSLGIANLRRDLVTAEQVHGERIAIVTRADAGAGAFSEGAPPIPATDALVTDRVGLPLLMMYADCVPVILVATHLRRAVCVVHAGWRGALSRLPGKAARLLASHAGCETSDLRAYIGPHIRACCYEVGEEILSHFCNSFDTIRAVDGRLDLTAAVRESLIECGVGEQRTAEVEACTRDHADMLFSYRAAPLTGRHGALAVIAEGE
ncbi:MAG: polyphenol oxidase family protein [Anaerosomatales bacterium]